MTLTMLAALALLSQAATTPPEDPARAAYDAEASRLAGRARFEERCIEMPRPEGESVEACTERRIALQDAPPAGPPPAVAGEARRGCETEGLQAGETLGMCIARRAAPTYDIFATVDVSSAFDIDPQAAPPPPPRRPEPRATCRREYTRSEDGSSTSSTIICGNGNHDAVEAMLDSLARPNH